MAWRDLIIAVLVALMLGALLVSAARWRRPGEETTRVGVGAVALVVAGTLLGTAWGLLAWVAPLGGATWAASWLPFLIAFVLAAVVVGVAFLRRRGGWRGGPIA